MLQDKQPPPSDATFFPQQTKKLIIFFQRCLLPRIINRDIRGARSVDRVLAVGVALPVDVARGVDLDVLVLKGGPGGDGHGDGPGRARLGQGHGGRGVPAAQLRDGARDLDGDARVDGHGLVEGHRAARRCRCGRRSGRGSGGGGGGGSRRSRGLGVAAARAGGDGNVSTSEVDLAGLEAVPLPREQGVVGGEVGRQSNLLGNGVSTSDGGRAGVESRAVDALAAAVAKLLAGEPLVVPAGLALGAVGAVVAGLPGDVGTRQDAGLEAVLGGLLVVVGGRVGGVQELGDDAVVLAEAVGEHAAVVTVGVEAPDDVDGVARSIGLDDLAAPVGSGRVVVDADSGIVTTYTTSANRGRVQVRP